MRQNQKWKIPHTLLERWTLCCSSFKNYELKVKLQWVGAHRRKKSAFFVTFILSEGNFVNICILSQCILYLINFQHIHHFTYQKTLHHTFMLLVFKIVKILQCIHKNYSDFLDVICHRNAYCIYCSGWNYK